MLSAAASQQPVQSIANMNDIRTLVDQNNKIIKKLVKEIDKMPLVSVSKFHGTAVYKSQGVQKKWTKRNALRLSHDKEKVDVGVYIANIFMRYEFVPPISLSTGSPLNPEPKSIRSLAKWNRAAINEIAMIPTQIDEWHRTLKSIKTLLRNVQVFLENSKDGNRASEVANELNKLSNEFEVLARPADEAPKPRRALRRTKEIDDDLKDLPKTPRASLL